MVNKFKAGDLVYRHPDFLHTPRDLNWGKDEVYLVERVTNFNEVVLVGKVGYYVAHRFIHTGFIEPVNLNDFL